VSLFMDVSSEMIHALLPVFLVSTLGASAALVGLVEGTGEGAASLTKFFSGAISDRLGHRKRLALIGYGVAAVTKPVFALAITPFEVLFARFVDRVGKGIRGAPRDALIADVTPEAVRGAAYGLRQSLDTVGAFAGPLLAVGLLAGLGLGIRSVFLLASLPALISVAVLALAVEEPPRPEKPREDRPRFRREELRALAAPFWEVVAIGAVFTLARFSEAFLVLRASELGLSLGLVPLVLVAMNAVYSGVSTPAGALSDRVDRRLLLAASLVALIAADLVLAGFGSIAGALVGAALWGLHMGLSQGLLAAMVADTAPERLRGTAFGLFHLVTGVATFLASVLAGLLWEGVGAGATFVWGAALAGIALVALLARVRRG
jgi:MFS family permease